MKILYIITQADGGGAQTYVLSLAKHFGGAIAAGVEDTKLFDVARSAGLQTYQLRHLKRSISPWHDLLAIFEIARLIKKEQPDIIHLNSTKAGFLGSLAAGWAKSPAKIIFTAHGFRYLEPLSPVGKFFYLWIEKFAAPFRDYIIAVSETDRRSAISSHVIAPEKISTIYNGLSPIEFLARDEAKTQLNLPQNVLICGNTSNFYTTKGQDILIDAVALLPKEVIDKTLFVIFGSGPKLLTLKSKILNLKLQSSFRLLGQTKNAAIYLKALDVFVLPSRKEGFPYALLEAMQAGLPIIATAVGGIPEALDEAGLLIPAQNPQALSRTITSLIQNPELRTQLSQKAFERSKLFTTDKMLAETKKIYEKTSGTLWDC